MSAEKPLSEVRLAEIRARLEAATPGPWEVCDFAEVGRNLGTDQAEILVDCDLWGVKNPQWKANAEFIANAPTDLKDLLAERDAMSAETQCSKQHYPGPRGVFQCLKTQGHLDCCEDQFGYRWNCPSLPDPITPYPLPEHFEP